MAPPFLLLYTITNKKTVKLMQVDRLLSASKTSPAEHIPITLVRIPYSRLIYLGWDNHRVLSTIWGHLLVTAPCHYPS